MSEFILFILLNIIGFPLYCILTGPCSEKERQDNLMGKLKGKSK